MLDQSIKKKLEISSNLPSIPLIISEVLNAIDNPSISAAALANIIERDQSLTARVLTVANSPFYGFARKISTIDLAIVVMGTNTIKEIVLSLIIQRIILKRISLIFNTKSFWQYSVFCGACSRFLARKLGYRLSGEAFVSGLMHDLGILVILQNLPKEFQLIRKLQSDNGLSFVEAENKILNCNHCDIGAWLAEKWFLPEKLCDSIKYHHTTQNEFKIINNSNLVSSDNIESNNDDVEQPLTMIVAMTEWFAQELGFKLWANEENNRSKLYLADVVLEDMKKHDILEPDSAFETLKIEILDEYEKASVYQMSDTKPLYK